MRTLLLAAVAAAAIVSVAAAQEHHGPDLSRLPPECRSAIEAAGGGHGAMGDMGAMGGEAAPAGERMMLEHQRQGLEAMMRMQEPMMAAHAIEDPDLSFNCGMIAHHQGAIDMARIELEHGKDEATKALAQKIIEDQEREIREMTEWVKVHAGK